MVISMIVAVAQNNVIGKDNSLIWRLSDDLKFFKKITTGHSIIMGRKTYESIGKPLPNRNNIVITRSTDLQIEGCYVVNSIPEALALASTLDGCDESFIIGGEKIYKQAMPYIQRAYVTYVLAYPDGDAFFDQNVFRHWKKVDSIAFQRDEKNQFDFEIATLQKTIG